MSNDLEETIRRAIRKAREERAEEQGKLLFGMIGVLAFIGGVFWLIDAVREWLR